MYPLHKFLFMHTTPQFLEEGHRALQGIGDWYVKKRHSYTRISGLNDTPHLLPMFVPNRLLLKEITYEMGVRGITTSLIGSSKRV